MRLLGLELKNFKSYTELSLSFDSASDPTERSVTAIVGENGAGKTSILEAVGAALFDYVEGSHRQLIREGERSAEVRVTIAVRDQASPDEERVYTVVRRFGYNAGWQVQDDDAKVWVTHKAEETRRWIAQQLGLDETYGADLASLFRDAVGVPQGTMTAPFLDDPRSRKEKFDRLLRLKEFEKASENLRPVEREIERKMEGLQADIAQLARDLEDLPRVRDQLQSTLFQLNDHLQELSMVKGRYDAATKLIEGLRRMAELDRQLQAAENSLKEAQEELQKAQKASSVAKANEQAYQDYLRAQEDLERIRRRLKRWRPIKESHERLSYELNVLEKDRTDKESRLNRLMELVAQLPELEQLARREEEIRRQLDCLRRDRDRLEELTRSIGKLTEDRQRVEQRLEEARREVAKIESCRELAQKLHLLRQERDALVEQLSIARQASQDLSELQRRRSSLTGQLRTKEQQLAEARQKAGQLPDLERQLADAQSASDRLQPLLEEKARLEALLNEATVALAQSRGGNCPFLKEPCRNMTEGQDLEAYFRHQVDMLGGDLEQISEQIARLEPLAKELRRIQMDATIARQASAQVEGLKQEVARLERDLEDCSREIAVKEEAAGKEPLLGHRLQELDSELKEAEDANARLASLDQLNLRLQDLELNLDRLEGELAELEQEHQEIIERLAKQADLEAELEQLGSPGPLERLQDARRAEQDAEKLREDLDELEKEIKVKQAELERVRVQLQAFPGDMEQQEQKLEEQIGRLKEGYDSYLLNRWAIDEMSKREARVTEDENAVRALLRQKEEYEAALRREEVAFDPQLTFVQGIDQKVQALTDEVNRLRDEENRLNQEIGSLEQERAHLERRKDELEKKLTSKAEKEAELGRLEDVLRYVGRVRDDIRRVGDEVGRKMVDAIAHRATTIFHDVMGGIAGELSWSPQDYSLRLQVGSSERLFPQLSGGEQMAAALAIRLALLQNLSTVRFAFFDEPTQNLDQTRREALAEQISNIQNIRGFDQIFVISHDDTFTARTDRVVRVTKRAGVSAAVLE